MLKLGKKKIDWRAGMIIGGKYALTREVGRGGCGKVFEAQNTWIGRRVAVKVLKPEYAEHPEVLPRFKREAQAAAQIGHPNIIDVLDMGQDSVDGSFFIVEEFLDGVDLLKHINARGRLEALEVVRILAPIIGALDAAHARGIVHRDVKPENVFLARAPSGEIVPKLIDFGIARVRTVQTGGRQNTWMGVAIGTARYMSPEQARGEAIDARTDIWAIGVLFFEALSGKCPFEGPNEIMIISKITSERAPRLLTLAPFVADDVAAVVDRALEPNANRRFQSMREFAEALTACTSLRVSRVPESPRQSSPAPLQVAAQPAPVPLAAPLPAPRTPPAHSNSRPLAPSDPLPLVTRTPKRGSNADSSGPISVIVDLEELGPLSEPPEPATDPNFTAPTTEPDLADEVEDDLDDPIDEDDAPTRQWLVPRKIIEAVRARSISRELELTPYATGGESVSNAETARLVDAAREALELNALEDAIRFADNAIAAQPTNRDHVARMRLTQSIAALWLGRVDESERWVQEALDRLPPFGTGWLTAIGHLAIASGDLGKNERLLSLYDALLQADGRRRDRVDVAAFVVNACRVTIQLLRAGRIELATDLEKRAENAAKNGVGDVPVAKAWLDAARAQFRQLDGDPSATLRLREASVSRFIESGDARNVCRQHANIGDAYVKLGAYDEADRVLCEALASAESMRLYFSPVIKANLGVVRSRLGRHTEAKSLLEEALSELAKRSGNARFEAFTRVYLAEVALMLDEVLEAGKQASLAVDIAHNMPAVHAYALGVRSEILVVLGKRNQALENARDAVSIIDAHGGTEEGEVRIRLAYYTALECNGRRAEARAALEIAHARLLKYAAKIGDMTLRRSYLQNVRENATTLSLARSILASSPGPRNA